MIRIYLTLVLLGASSTGVTSALQVGGEAPAPADDPIRQFAVATVTPDYPLAAQRRGEVGVAVARVAIDGDGRVRTVTLLESPGREIGAAVSSALWRWRFRPASAGPSEYQRPPRLTGTVTFYFHMQGGVYRVTGPKETPRLRARRPEAARR